ncbi:MAG: cyanophycin synthetase, partial [Anaerolineales bacterium]|nr:cyanophycin synthetase [Anaerolineales bacterium]
IAHEKAGIIKRRIPVLVAPQLATVHSILQGRAAAVGAPLITVDAEWAWRCDRRSADGQQFILWPIARPQEEHSYQLPLIGDHQAENATVAVALVQQLREQGWRIPQRAITQGLKTVQWPARCEVLSGEVPVMLDCAHNRASAKRLVKTLQDYFPGRHQVLVFGAMRDKDVTGMFAELLPGCSEAIMTSTGAVRAMRPHDLFQAAAEYHCPAYPATNLSSALAQAKHTAAPDGIVVVTGSVALVGAAHAALLKSTTLSAATRL